MQGPSFLESRDRTRSSLNMLPGSNINQIKIPLIQAHIVCFLANSPLIIKTKFAGCKTILFPGFGLFAGESYWAIDIFAAAFKGSRTILNMRQVACGYCGCLFCLLDFSGDNLNYLHNQIRPFDPILISRLIFWKI